MALVDFLLSWKGSEQEQEQAEEYGLVDVSLALLDWAIRRLIIVTLNHPQDCPYFSGMSQYVLYTAGATLASASTLKNGETDIAIVWDGGR